MPLPEPEGSPVQFGQVSPIPPGRVPGLFHVRPQEVSMSQAEGAMPLNPKQQKWAEHYAATGNALKSAIAAGYSAKSARSQSDRMLKNAEVMRYVAQLAQPAQNARIATAEERQAFWTDVMYGRVKDDEGNAPRMSDRLKASELLGKAQADFVDRVEHSGDLGVIGIEVIPPK